MENRLTEREINDDWVIAKKKENKTK